jgi:hypothetical protein
VAVLWRRLVRRALDVVIVMIKFVLTLSLLLVWAFTRSRLAAFAQETARSLELEYERQAPAVLPAPSEVEEDATRSVPIG